MRQWIDRPAEVAHLLNPAYCALVATSFSAGYMTNGTSGVDVSLFFVSIPLVMHKQTRESLPSTIRTKLHAWMSAHEPLRIGLADRCRAMVPFVKEAIVFACERKLLALHDSGYIVPLSTKKVKADALASDSARETIEKAHFTGRWLRTAGPPHAIYSILGLRP